MLAPAVAQTGIAQAAPNAVGLIGKRAAKPIRLDVTFILNGSPAGDVGVETTLDGTASVGLAQLIARLTPVASPSLITELTAKAAGRELVPVVELRSDGFPILFDIGALQLRVDIPLDARALNRVSIAGNNQFGTAESAPPSNLSFGMSVTLADRINTTGTFRDFGRDRFNLATQGFINVGGKNGVYLTFLAGLQEGRSPFRNRTTLFHDDVENAVRASLGDIDPLSSGAFATPISLVGVGVERLYQTIQPYRNLRPAGRGALAVERPSRVEVFVNGAPYRTITLASGRHDLRDFPFSTD